MYIIYIYEDPFNNGSIYINNPFYMTHIYVLYYMLGRLHV